MQYVEYHIEKKLLVLLADPEGIPFSDVAVRLGLSVTKANEVVYRLLTAHRLTVWAWIAPEGRGRPTYVLSHERPTRPGKLTQVKRPGILPKALQRLHTQGVGAKLRPHQIVPAFLPLLECPVWLKQRNRNHRTHPFGSFWVGRDGMVRKARADWWHEGGACRLHLGAACGSDVERVAALLQLPEAPPQCLEEHLPECRTYKGGLRYWELNIVAYPAQWPALLPWLVTLVHAYEDETPELVATPPVPLVVEWPGAAAPSTLHSNEIWTADVYNAMKVYKYAGYVAWEAQ